MAEWILLSCSNVFHGGFESTRRWPLVFFTKWRLPWTRLSSKFVTLCGKSVSRRGTEVPSGRPVNWLNSDLISSTNEIKISLNVNINCWQWFNNELALVFKEWATVAIWGWMFALVRSLFVRCVEYRFPRPLQVREIITIDRLLPSLSFTLPASSKPGN